MNLLDHTVLEVISTPFEKYNKWWVEVVCECYGKEFMTQIMVDTKEQAESIKVGYTFLG